VAETVRLQVMPPSLRWLLKQAAAERRLPLRRLVTTILRDWLLAHGYGVDPGALDREWGKRLR
jgi:hypothetical protein